jgi:hypothetical protein
MVDGRAMEEALLASVLHRTMTSTIYQWPSGTSAFLKTDSRSSLVMTCGDPYVEWGFRIEKLEQWLTTLEETISHEANTGNRYDLESLYFSLKAAHTRHLQEHEAVVTEAPTADDLQAYLAAYAAAVSTASQEGYDRG